MLGILVAFLALLLLSGFFSSAEVVMMRLSRLQVRRLAKQKQPNAEKLVALKEDPHKLLQTILIGNNLVNIGAASLATALAIELFGNAGVGIATGVVTFLVLLFGEIIPKSLGVNHATRIALAITPTMAFLKWLLTPVIIVIDAIARIFTRLFGEAEQERVTEEEISDLLSVGERDGMIKKRERRMILNIFKFDDTTVEEVMTPRLDVFLVSASTKLEEALPDILAKGYSRIPVYEGRMDNVKGVVHVRDLLGVDGKKRFGDVMKPVLFIPENKKLDALLREFQRKKQPFGVVLDEHGLFIGITTIEDLLEELVGEIYDESDAAEVVERVGEEIVVPGKMGVEELNEEHGLSLPLSEEYDTVAGLVMERLGRIPKQGEEVKLRSAKLHVERVQRNRVVKVRVRPAKGAHRAHH